jgi:chemotaxis protein MotB
MNHRHASTNGVNVASRSGTLAEPRSVNLLNANRRLDIRQSEGESWIMVYLDVITLLLVAFLLVIAQMALKQQVEVREEVTSEKEQVSQPLDGTGESQVDAPFTALQQDDMRVSPDSILMENQLAETIKLTKGLEDLEVVIESGKVNLNLPEKILFETGKSELLGAASEVLGKIIPILVEYSAQVSVEGHTDDIPIHSAKFPSNWELSSARATTVLRYLVNNGVPNSQVRAIAYADTRPVADNATAEGRSRNRRVNILVHMPSESIPGA